MRLDGHRVHAAVAAASDDEVDLRTSKCVEARDATVCTDKMLEDGRCVRSLRFGHTSKIRDANDSHAIANTDLTTFTVLRRNRVLGLACHMVSR